MVMLIHAELSCLVGLLIPACLPSCSNKSTKHMALWEGNVRTYLLWLMAFTVQLLEGLNLSASFFKSAAVILGSRVLESWASYCRPTTKSWF